MLNHIHRHHHRRHRRYSQLGLDMVGLMVTVKAVVMEMATTLGTILGTIGDHQQLPHSHRPMNMPSPCARRIIFASLFLISMVRGSFLPGLLTRLLMHNEKRSGPFVEEAVQHA